jgi:hypothetical protein
MIYVSFLKQDRIDLVLSDCALSLPAVETLGDRRLDSCKKAYVLKNGLSLRAGRVTRDPDDAARNGGVIGRAVR